MRLFKVSFITFFALASLTFQVNAQETNNQTNSIFPFMGRINGSRVNLRSKPSTKSVVITQVKENEDIVVVGEEGTFYEIFFPKNVSFWVYGKYVQDSVISGDKVHVRTGPGVNFPSMMQLSANTPVVEKSRMGSWVAIQAPEKLSGWISSEYVSYFSTLDTYDDKLSDEKQAREQLKKAEAIREEEFNKPMETVNFERVINAYKAMLAKYPFSKEAKTALRAINDLEIKKLYSLKDANSEQIDKTQVEREKILIQIQKIREDFYQGRTSADQQAVEAARNLMELLEQAYPDTPETDIAREVYKDIARINYKQDEEKAEVEAASFAYSGKLKKVGRKSLPGTHMLVRGVFNKRVCFLRSDKVDLDIYINNHVETRGPINFVKGYEPPLQDVKEIQVIDKHY